MQIAYSAQHINHEFFHRQVEEDMKAICEGQTCSQTLLWSSILRMPDGWTSQFCNYDLGF